ncbi:antibiotic biosynthesis monooxygenase [Methylobacterium sp. NMS12]|uniref:hypothetical protein n=1 Tax=Methylobacterium sp. NMS12 TaxID=3079766 RepID=UPI003F881238
MSGATTSVSIVTQTTIRPESADAFARWQTDTSAVVAAFPGFIEQQLIPPRPPLQVDWVIVQRFHSLEQAKTWLASPSGRSASRAPRRCSSVATTSTSSRTTPARPGPRRSAR